ncbi:hypothetical protein DFH06DRAFT_1146602 [Mycena polygramma]|nr:hypothetical protein DFH06DRAFT_1146602 [Mycena polygramma]
MHGGAVGRAALFCPFRQFCRLPALAHANENAMHTLIGLPSQRFGPVRCVWAYGARDQYDSARATRLSWHALPRTLRAFWRVTRLLSLAPPPLPPPPARPRRSRLPAPPDPAAPAGPSTCASDALNAAGPQRLVGSVWLTQYGLWRTLRSFPAATCWTFSPPTARLRSMLNYTLYSLCPIYSLVALSRAPSYCFEPSFSIRPPSFSNATQKQDSFHYFRDDKCPNFSPEELNGWFRVSIPIPEQFFLSHSAREGNKVRCPKPSSVFRFTTGAIFMLGRSKTSVAKFDGTQHAQIDNPSNATLLSSPTSTARISSTPRPNDLEFGGYPPRMQNMDLSPYKDPPPSCVDARRVPSNLGAAVVKRKPTGFGWILVHNTSDVSRVYRSPTPAWPRVASAAACCGFAEVWPRANTLTSGWTVISREPPELLALPIKDAAGFLARIRSSVAAHADCVTLRLGPAATPHTVQVTIAAPSAAPTCAMPWDDERRRLTVGSDGVYGANGACRFREETEHGGRILGVAMGRGKIEPKRAFQCRPEREEGRECGMSQWRRVCSEAGRVGGWWRLRRHGIVHCALNSAGGDGHGGARRAALAHAGQYASDGCRCRRVHAAARGADTPRPRCCLSPAMCALLVLL